METPQFLDMLPQPAFLVRSGSIAYANPAAAAFLLEPGTPIADLLFTGTEEYAAFDGGNLCLQLQHGPALWEASVTRSPDGDLFLLEQPEDPALQALSLAAMELRDPLGTAMQEAERLPADTALLKRSLYQLLRRISNMSDAAGYQENPEGSPELRDICAVLDEIFEKATAMAEQAGIRLRYRGLAESHICPVDTQRLERGVYNLISNAAGFSQPGTVIDAALRRSGKRLYLTVSDSGSGIPSALRGQLYSRYRRQPGLEDPRFGIGLGMVLIRAAAAAHKGTLLLETGDAGTKVTLTFSLAQPQGQLRSPLLRADYTGERDHSLVELSDLLPPETYL